MTVREIQAHLQEMYGTEVSPSLISSVTDAVSEEVKTWQARPLDPIYPIVYLDCIHVKVREGAVRVKAVYLAIGITMEGNKEVLGLWLAQNEGAKFWLQVVTELRNRGVQDIFIACVDGLKGFPEAIEAVFPKTVVQLCIVHMVRHSLNYVSWKRRKEVAADLRHVYQAATAEEAEQRLGEFEDRWDEEYLPIGQSWRRGSTSIRIVILTLERWLRRDVKDLSAILVFAVSSIAILLQYRQLVQYIFAIGADEVSWLTRPS